MLTDDIDFFAPEWRQDPYPLYHRLRAEAPVWFNETFGEYVLTRHADCEAVLRDPRWSSNPEHLTRRDELDSADVRLWLRDIDANILLFMDPPDHTRLRRLVSQAFTPRAVDRLRSHIGRLVDGLLDEVAAAPGEPLDLMTALAYPLPVIVICELLGVPVADRDQFGGWSSAASRLLDGEIDQETGMQGMVAVASLLNYFNDLFDERRRAPCDDLLSALLAAEEAGDRLSETELRTMVLLLFVAGHETTMNLIGNGTLALLRHPDQLERLRRDPSLAPSAVEELLRYDSPVHLTGRIATEDLEVAGVPMPKGQQVVTLIAAANRDPQRFADPDRLDIGRDDNRHLSFSHGAHHCLGASLARLEGQLAIATLVQRFPTLRLAGDPEVRDHLVLRGLKSLPVTLH